MSLNSDAGGTTQSIEYKVQISPAIIIRGAVANDSGRSRKIGPQDMVAVRQAYTVNWTHVVPAHFPKVAECVVFDRHSLAILR